MSKTIFQYTFSLLFVAVMFTSCDIKKNKEVEPETFVKIYDNADLSKKFFPFDIEQTDDNGFLILGGTDIPESDFHGVYLMKTDKDGNILSESVLSADFVNPVRTLIKAGGSFYFFCMNRLTLESKLMQVDQSGNAVEVAQLTEVIYPLNASVYSDNNSLLLLHYNREDKRTGLARVSLSGTIIANKEFDLGFGDFDAEESIIKHLAGIGKQLPFYCGTLGNSTCYFNGYYQYTLSLVFFDMNSASDFPPVGVVQGYKDERAMSSLIPLDGNYFAGSRYAYGDNYIMSRVSLSTAPGSISSSSGLIGNLMYELQPDAQVVAEKRSINGVSTAVFSTTTRNNQIVLYFYDAHSGGLLGARHLGFSNPYRSAAFCEGANNSLAVVGTTWIAGRFPRICLFKLSSEELQKTLSGE